MQRQLRHRAAVRADAPGLIQRPQAREQIPGGGELRRRRRIQPLERRPVGAAPAGELEGERRQVRLEDLRRREGGEGGLRALAPGTKAHPRRGAPGAALALLGGRARDALHLEPSHAAARIEAGAAHQARVHHRAHARDGEAGLGEIGGEHDLAAPRGIGGERAVLGLEGEIAVERHERTGGRIERGAECGLDAADLTRAGEEHEHVAGGFGERTPHQLHHAPLGRIGAGGGAAGQERQARCCVVRRHRVSAPRAAHQRCPLEEPRHRGAVEGRRHHQDLQLRVQVRARIEGERKAQVRLQAALVELIEDHRRDALERGIILQPARQHPLRQHLQAGRGRDARVLAHAVTDGAAHRLAQGLRHALRHRPRREAARLEHQQALAGRPRTLEQRQRHHRALARPGGRLEHRRGCAVQGGDERGQRRIDGQTRLHQMWTRSSGGRYSLSPGCTLKAAYQGSMLRTTPLTRNCGGLCGLESAWARSDSSFSSERQICA